MQSGFFWVFGKNLYYSGLNLNRYGVASPCRTGLNLIHYKIRTGGAIGLKSIACFEGSGLFFISRQSGNKKAHTFLRSVLFYLVEVSGIEPLTSCMPCKRSTN